jgi:hypothetical protein
MEGHYGVIWISASESSLAVVYFILCELKGGNSML